MTLVKALVHALETEKFKYIRKNAVDSLARLVGLSGTFLLLLLSLLLLVFPFAFVFACFLDVVIICLLDSLNETIIDALLVALQDSESMVSRRACEVLTNLYRDHVTQHSEGMSAIFF